ncbi:alpha/beta hydrolase [Glaciihabitans arcticus]|uniref:Alpha/beta hydrolase n=1 Tax=Glaciihabitans arcticus TaxID=2668039 RepID=A0A4Q9GQR9_9MICO|nr:alpha/beta hydrolase [Glaciihabitans arcticus]TBN57011.1 alpha/beta hydrolase [Glaciihabitans arcticus]
MVAEIERRFRGATFYTSRDTFNELAIAVQRFPASSTGGRNTAPINYVLVHGIGVSARYFQPLARELAKRGTVWLVDLPGYGSAPNPKRDVSIRDHAEVVAAFLARSGIENPVVVGHSMGCQVVSELALLHPELVDSIALLAPTIERGERRLLTQATRLGLDMLREPLRANWVVLTDYLFRCGLPYYLRQLPHLLGDAIEDRLPSITAKAVVIAGHRDLVVPPTWAAEVAALLPNGELAIVEGPHVIMFTDPISIAAVLERRFDP